MCQLAIQTNLNLVYFSKFSNDLNDFFENRHHYYWGKRTYNRTDWSDTLSFSFLQFFQDSFVHADSVIDNVKRIMNSTIIQFLIYVITLV